MKQDIFFTRCNHCSKVVLVFGGHKIIDNLLLVLTGLLLHCNIYCLILCEEELISVPSCFIFHDFGFCSLLKHNQKSVKQEKLSIYFVDSTCTSACTSTTS